MMTANTSAVRIVEVGPRDGLQNVNGFIPTTTKIELISRLREAGLQTIEITSVVNPKAIPQLADCKAVLSNPTVAALQDHKSLRLPVLIPNLKGLEIAAKYGVNEVAVFVSATEAFSQANIKCSVDEGLRRATEVAAAAKLAGMAVRGYISCIFADPYSGLTAPSAVLHCARQLLSMGCYEISLGDTLGVGTASKVRQLITYLVKEGISVEALAGHFHDTYGQAVGNVWQAYNCGVRVFDSSVGGLGGCPFAPDAKGNVATEDLVYMFQQSGVHTGVDLIKLANIGSWISEQLSKQNDSRAGAAILAKQKGLAQKGTVPDTQLPEPRLSWKLESSQGELKILRAGVNLKLVLNRPKIGNALTSSMISKLTEVIENAKNDKSISRIVITGNGKFFCTGMDLGKTSSPVAQGGSASKSQFDRLTRLFEAIDNAPQVTISSMNGPAFGGGVGLAFACDIRFAVKTAVVTLSEVKLGLCPATISKYVIREWGPAFTREAMLSARRVLPSELKALGIIANVASDNVSLDKAVDEYVAGLALAAPNASKMSKELVRLDVMDAGGQRQARGIESLFEEMMQTDAEGAWGLKQFQAGNKSVDWDERRLGDLKAKL